MGQINMSDNKNIMINDLDFLNYMAEEILVNLRFDRFKYSADGNYIFMDPDIFHAKEYFEKYKEHSKHDYLNFRECEELKKIAFYDALEISFEEVINKYLKDDLSLMRAIARKGTWDVGAPILDDSITDDYLDQLFALRWKENLKLWTMQWNAKIKRYTVSYASSKAEYADINEALDTFMMLSEAEFSFISVSRKEVENTLVEKGYFRLKYDPSKDPMSNSYGKDTRHIEDMHLYIERIGKKS